MSASPRRRRSRSRSASLGYRKHNKKRRHSSDNDDYKKSSKDRRSRSVSPNPKSKRSRTRKHRTHKSERRSRFSRSRSRRSKDRSTSRTRSRKRSERRSRYSHSRSRRSKDRSTSRTRSRKRSCSKNKRHKQEKMRHHKEKKHRKKQKLRRSSKESSIASSETNRHKRKEKRRNSRRSSSSLKSSRSKSSAGERSRSPSIVIITDSEESPRRSPRKRTTTSSRDCGVEVVCISSSPDSSPVRELPDTSPMETVAAHGSTTIYRDHRTIDSCQESPLRDYDSDNNDDVDHLHFPPYTAPSPLIHESNMDLSSPYYSPNPAIPRYMPSSPSYMPSIPNYIPTIQCSTSSNQGTPRYDSYSPQISSQSEHIQLSSIYDRNQRQIMHETPPNETGTFASSNSFGTPQRLNACDARTPRSSPSRGTKEPNLGLEDVSNSFRASTSHPNVDERAKKVSLPFAEKKTDDVPPEIRHLQQTVREKLEAKRKQLQGVRAEKLAKEQSEGLRYLIARSQLAPGSFEMTPGQTFNTPFEHEDVVMDQNHINYTNNEDVQREERIANADLSIEASICSQAERVACEPMEASKTFSEIIEEQRVLRLKQEKDLDEQEETLMHFFGFRFERNVDAVDFREGCLPVPSTSSAQLGILADDDSDSIDISMGSQEHFNPIESGMPSSEQQKDDLSPEEERLHINSEPGPATQPPNTVASEATEQSDEVQKKYAIRLDGDFGSFPFFHIQDHDLESEDLNPEDQDVVIDQSQLLNSMISTPEDSDFEMIDESAEGQDPIENENHAKSLQNEKDEELMEVQEQEKNQTLSAVKEGGEQKYENLSEIREQKEDGTLELQRETTILTEANLDEFSSQNIKDLGDEDVAQENQNQIDVVDEELSMDVFVQLAAVVKDEKNEEQCSLIQAIKSERLEDSPTHSIVVLETSNEGRAQTSKSPTPSAAMITRDLFFKIKEAYAREEDPPEGRTAVPIIPRKCTHKEVDEEGYLKRLHGDKIERLTDFIWKSRRESLCAKKSGSHYRKRKEKSKYKTWISDDDLSDFELKNKDIEMEKKRLSIYVSTEEEDEEDDMSVPSRQVASDSTVVDSKDPVEKPAVSKKKRIALEKLSNRYPGAQPMDLDPNHEEYGFQTMYQKVKEISRRLEAENPVTPSDDKEEPDVSKNNDIELTWDTPSQYYRVVDHNDRKFLRKCVRSQSKKRGYDCAQKVFEMTINDIRGPRQYIEDDTTMLGKSSDGEHTVFCVSKRIFALLHLHLNEFSKPSRLTLPDVPDSLYPRMHFPGEKRGRLHRNGFLIDGLPLSRKVVEVYADSPFNLPTCLPATVKYLPKNIMEKEFKKKITEAEAQEDEEIIDYNDKYCTCNCVDGECNQETCQCWLESDPRLWKGRLHTKYFYVARTFFCGKMCKCRGKCNNNLDLSRPRFKVEIFRHSSVLGYEIRALEPIAPDATVPFVCRDVVMTFTGEVMDENALRKKPQIHGAYALNLYTPEELDSTSQGASLWGPILKKPYGETSEHRVVVDPTVYGNEGRYVTHGCIPNMYTTRIFRNSRNAADAMIALVSWEPIIPGEVLTFDYGADYIEANLKNICLCGTYLCPGMQHCDKKKVATTKTEFLERYEKYILVKLNYLRKFMSERYALPPKLDIVLPREVFIEWKMYLMKEYKDNGVVPDTYIHPRYDFENERPPDILDQMLNGQFPALETSSVSSSTTQRRQTTRKPSNQAPKDVTVRTRSRGGSRLDQVAPSESKSSSSNKASNSRTPVRRKKRKIVVDNDEDGQVAGDQEVDDDRREFVADDNEDEGSRSSASNHPIKKKKGSNKETETAPSSSVFKGQRTRKPSDSPVPEEAGRSKRRTRSAAPSKPTEPLEFVKASSSNESTNSIANEDGGGPGKVRTRSDVPSRRRTRK